MKTKSFNLISFLRLFSQEMEIIAQALLNKSGENLQFMREDIDKALSEFNPFCDPLFILITLFTFLSENFVTYMPPVRAALAIINHGAK